MESTSSLMQENLNDSTIRWQSQVDATEESHVSSKIEKTTLLPKSEQKRAKRIMGVLLNTLTKFKSDISNPSESLKRREELEAKIAEKQKREKEETEAIRLEQDLKRKEKDSLRKKAKEDEALKLQSVWDEQKEGLKKFLKTKDKMHIYYLPKLLTDEQKAELNCYSESPLE